MRYRECPACGDAPFLSQERYDGTYVYFKVGCSGCEIFSEESIAVSAKAHEAAEKEAGKLWNDFCEAVSKRNSK